MMPEFIFKETGLSKEIVGFYPKTPKLVYFKNEQAFNQNLSRLY
ncbi:MAG: hypothetical protein CM15mP102_03720 [Flavobacteriales bacterium]|nr:MAG: hypothetical protein CM15mP102_03720 [Flavobacteriales bacterium]